MQRHTDSEDVPEAVRDVRWFAVFVAAAGALVLLLIYDAATAARSSTAATERPCTQIRPDKSWCVTAPAYVPPKP